MTHTTSSDNRAIPTRMIVLCGLFAALIAVGAFIRIPIPYIAFSMQTMFVSLSGMLLGKKWGAISVLVYLIVGLVGMPVFTQGGGPSYVLQPSFGFLIGFVFCAYVTGAMTEKIKTPTTKNLLLAQLPGIAIYYAIGLPYFYLISTQYLNNDMGIAALFIYCFAATLPGDIVKSLLNCWLGKRLIPTFRKNYS